MWNYQLVELNVELRKSQFRVEQTQKQKFKKLSLISELKMLSKFVALKFWVDPTFLFFFLQCIPFSFSPPTAKCQRRRKSAGKILGYLILCFKGCGARLNRQNDTAESQQKTAGGRRMTCLLNASLAAGSALMWAEMTKKNSLSMDMQGSGWGREVLGTLREKRKSTKKLNWS